MVEKAEAMEIGEYLVKQWSANKEIMKCRILFVFLGVAVSVIFAGFNPVFAQGTAFTYQGNLSLNAAPVNGNYDMQFALRPQANGAGQVGSVLTNAPVGVTNGLFTVVLDFGNVFATHPLFLEIGLRTNGSLLSYTILSPVQLITSTPYAVQALTSQGFTGTISDAQLSTNIPTLNGNSVFTGHVAFNNASGNFNGSVSGAFTGSASGTFTGNVTSNFNGTATGTFIGNGASLTNLNITNLVGVVQSNPNWQLVQSASQQAVVANNYLTTNAAQTTLILPANPLVGSTLRFAGSGGNGWVIGQNTGQSIITSPLGLPAGQLFTPRGSSLSWQALASSADGLRLAAAYGGGVGFVYYSSDGGTTWTQSDAPQLNWTGIAASSDGLRMVAVPNSGSSHIYTSTNGGTNWVAQLTSPTESFTSVASSANGINLVAAPGSTGEFIYTSNNGGTNWTQRISGQTWTGAASSADGTKLVAVPSGAAQIYVSINSGVTWTNTGPSMAWSAVASSADGTKLVATVKNGNIYTSGDSGATWTARASSASWSCVASSSNGINLAAAYGNGYIYTSSDGGQNWIQRTNGVPSGMQPWSAIASSADGSRLLAAISTGFLYNSIAATTVTTGTLAGGQYSTIELQYIGNGQWMPLSAYGSFTGK